MTVKELIERLSKLQQDANVILCMDWTALPEKERPSSEQWEDDLGDIATAGKTAKNVYLVNKNFK